MYRFARKNVVIGDRVLLACNFYGAVIGSEGFGFIEVGEGLTKIPQVGNVVLESGRRDWRQYHD